MLLALTAVDPSFDIFTRDVTQAYVQARTPIQRKIFLRPPPELGLSDDMVLRVDKPLYGIVESGVHWYWTYIDYHVSKLDMKSSTHDPCLLFTKPCLDTRNAKDDAPRGMVCMQTDDTVNSGNCAFREKEELHSKTFKSKPATMLTDGTKIIFNGAQLGLKNGIFNLTQPEQIGRLKELIIDSDDKDAFISQRARASYIAGMCRPNVSYAIAYCWQILEPTKSDMRYLNTIIRQLQDTSNRGLNFVKLDAQDVVSAIFTDAGFATNQDLSSQLGFLVTLMDKKGRTNVIHYASVKSRRISRSVLSSELYAMVVGFDVGSTMNATLRDIFSRRIPMHLYTDSRCLYDSVTGIAATAEKRLLIDLGLLRESFELREIENVFWIPSAQNPADGLTKKSPSPALRNLILDNKLSLTPNAWVQRKEEIRTTSKVGGVSE